MGEIIKHAKLFEAGEYPDKRLTMTEADLDDIVRENEEVPLTVGHLDPHSENPLRLGTVGNYYRKGKELFGVIRFVPEAWWLALRSGARLLSVCLDRLRRRLLEVSLVVHPRVGDARVRFDGAARLDTPFELTLDERTTAVRSAVYERSGPGVWVAEVYEDAAIVEREGEVLRIPYRLGGDGEVVLGEPERVERRYVPLGSPDENRAEARFDARVVEALGREREARRLLRAERAENRIAVWKREGRLAVAAEEPARTLLSGAPETAELFARFVEAQPPGLLVRELIPAPAGEPEELPDLDTGEAAFCERSGIEPEDYRRMKARPGWRALRA